MQKIQLEAVLGYISPRTRGERSDMDLTFYASQAFKSLGVKEDREKVCVLLPIYKNKATLPNDALYINKFNYIEELDENFPCTVEATCECGVCLCDNVKEDKCLTCDCPVEPLGYTTRTNNVCKYQINYKLWLDSLENSYEPVKLEFKGNQRKHIGKDCLQQCNYGWSLNGNTIGIDFESGWIHMVYEAYIKVDGKYMIPNETDLLRGLALYAEAMVEFDRNEQQSMNKYQTLLLQSDNLLKKYRGKKLLEGISFDRLNDLIGRNTTPFNLVNWRP